jgi:hypothetical protein
MIDTPLRTEEKPRFRGFRFDRDYMQALQPAAMDSELLCWLPTGGVVEPPLPDQLLTLVMLALLVTGFSSHLGSALVEW